MPRWLQRLLAGTQRVDYDVRRRSGVRTCGGFEAPYRETVHDLRARVERATSVAGDPTVSFKLSISAGRPGILDKLPRILAVRKSA